MCKWWKGHWTHNHLKSKFRERVLQGSSMEVRRTKTMWRLCQGCNGWLLICSKWKRWSIGCPWSMIEHSHCRQLPTEVGKLTIKLGELCIHNGADHDMETLLLQNLDWLMYIVKFWKCNRNFFINHRLQYCMTKFCMSPHSQNAWPNTTFTSAIWSDPL